MEIKKLSDYKGASRFGKCVECGEMETDFHRLCRLQFNGGSICLCTSCFMRTKVAMNNFEPQKDNGFFDEIMEESGDGEVYEKIKEIINEVKEQEDENRKLGHN